MKKTIAIAVTLIFTMTIQAKVFRVNNVKGMAPYTQINDAVKVAHNGDTIMVDGAVEYYEDATLDKRLVLQGPGYLQNENGIASATNQAASVEGLKIMAEGCTIEGIRVAGTGAGIGIKASKTVIRRCLIDGTPGSINIVGGANNCVFHQNYFRGDAGISGDYYDPSYNHQITNNIFSYQQEVISVRSSYIAYNTFIKNGELSCYDLTGCRIEKNVAFGWEDDQWKTKSTYTDNYIFAKDAFLDSNRDYPETDKQILQMTNKLPAANGYGAFAGKDPYVISGIPTAP